MERIRKPFEGITNILRFNWHYYALAALFICVTLFLPILLPYQFHLFFYVLRIVVVATILISILVSCYIYDISQLYQFRWLQNYKSDLHNNVNIHAGFDETSYILNTLMPDSKLMVFDFFDPEKHTEISIKRARNATAPYIGTTRINTLDIPLAPGSTDAIFLTFSAHEIRDDEERALFFEQLKNALTNSGKIFVTEHLRDLPNFLVYNIGFFHFLSGHTWHNTFKKAGLRIASTIKATPFTTTFILERNGYPS